MKPIFPVLFTVILFYLTACTSTSEPLPTAIVQVPTPSITNTIATPPATSANTTTPTPKFTPLPTFGSSPTPLPAQQTAVWLAVTARISDNLTAEAKQLLIPTARPAFTRAPTSTPTYVPATPAPGIWRILFYGGPCPPHEEYCDNDTVRDQDYYFINSDGSGLIPTSLDPQDDLVRQASSMRMKSIRFSPDNTMVAYGSEAGIHLLYEDGTEIALFSSLPTVAFDFLPEGGCVAGYLFVEGITVAKSCVGQSDNQVLATFTIPEPLTLPHFSLSPQGDALLIYGVDYAKGVRLYVKNMTDSSPPSLLYYEENLDGRYLYSGPVRWSADGQSIDFIVMGETSSFYTINRTGENLMHRFSLTEVGFVEADWSPDGQQLVLDGWNDETVGLFILDVNTGEAHPILPKFFIDSYQLIAWLAN